MEVISGGVHMHFDPTNQRRMAGWARPHPIQLELAPRMMPGPAPAMDKISQSVTLTATLPR
jgi:hypothetical protein